MRDGLFVAFVKRRAATDELEGVLRRELLVSRHAPRRPLHPHRRRRMVVVLIVDIVCGHRNAFPLEGSRRGRSRLRVGVRAPRPATRASSIPGRRVGSDLAQRGDIALAHAPSVFFVVLCRQLSGNKHGSGTTARSSSTGRVGRGKVSTHFGSLVEREAPTAQQAAQEAHLLLGFPVPVVVGALIHGRRRRRRWSGAQLSSTWASLDEVECRPAVGRHASLARARGVDTCVRGVRARLLLLLLPPVPDPVSNLSHTKNTDRRRLLQTKPGWGCVRVCVRARRRAGSGCKKEKAASARAGSCAANRYEQRTGRQLQLCRGQQKQST